MTVLGRREVWETRRLDWIALYLTCFRKAAINAGPVVLGFPAGLAFVSGSSEFIPQPSSTPLIPRGVRIVLQG